MMQKQNKISIIYQVDQIVQVIFLSGREII